MKLVIFDFDGVLANTIDLTYKIHVAKNQHFTYEKFKRFALGNFWEGYDRAIKDEGHIPPEDFYVNYKKGLDALTIEKILQDLVSILSQKYNLAIVSSTDSFYIKEFLEKENAQKYFSDILGSDIHRSKTTKIQSLLSKYDLLSRDAIFITDTLGDINEANECKVRSIGVTWGLHDAPTLKQGNPAKIIDDPRNLILAVEEMLQ